jgi:hypothetical protein
MCSAETSSIPLGPCPDRVPGLTQINVIGFGSRQAGSTTRSVIDVEPQARSFHEVWVSRARSLEEDYGVEGAFLNPKRECASVTPSIPTTPISTVRPSRMVLTSDISPRFGKYIFDQSICAIDQVALAVFRSSRAGRAQRRLGQRKENAFANAFVCEELDHTTSQRRGSAATN